MDYRALTMPDPRDKQVVVTVGYQHDYHGENGLYDAVGEGFVFAQGNRDKFHYVSDAEAFLAQHDDDVEDWFVLDVYEHGLIQYSLAGKGPQCQWDTARGGAIIGLRKGWFWPKGDERNRGAADDLAQAITDWANGSVHWFDVETVNGDLVDACGGFLGDSITDAVKNAASGYTVVEVKGEASYLVEDLVAA